MLGDDALPLFPEPKNGRMSALFTDIVKDSLIASGLMRDRNEFSKEGLLAASVLRSYKKAYRHVRIGNMYLGVANDAALPAILYNELYNSYCLTSVVSLDVVKAFMDNYGFDVNATTAESFPDAKALASVLSDSGSKRRMEILVDKFPGKIEESIFEAEGHIFLFDRISGMLKALSGKELAEHLKSILNMRESPNERGGSDGRDI